MEATAKRSAIAELMPRAKEDLSRLVAYRSVADIDVAPLQECIDAAKDVAAGFTQVGIQNVKLLEMPFGHSAVYGHSPAPEGVADRIALRALRRSTAARRNGSVAIAAI